VKPASLTLRARREDGIVLILVLIGVIAMALAGIALVRATQTTNLIAGNFAFKQAALAATDSGVELAFAQLDTLIVTTADAAFPAGCSAGACVYYPTRQATDSNGIPAAVGDWSTIPSTTINGAYAAQYVIDRLCSGALPVTDIATNCYIGQPNGSGPNRKVGDNSFSPGPQNYYRVSVRVSGPRNTKSFVQAIVAK
jgi:type IV pilus assembly protein PilX